MMNNFNQTTFKKKKKLVASPLTYEETIFHSLNMTNAPKFQLYMQQYEVSLN